MWIWKLTHSQRVFCEWFGSVLNCHDDQCSMEYGAVGGAHGASSSQPTKLSDDEFAKMIASAPFARGTAREVYKVPNNPDVIVKKLVGTFPGSNYIEWLVWQAVKSTHLADKFGECIAISESCRYLMMERLNNLAKSDRKNTPTVPVWVRDVKGLTSFGKNSTGGIKLRDYGQIDISKNACSRPMRTEDLDAGSAGDGCGFVWVPLPAYLTKPN
jgi:hypothetical protein